MKKIICVIFIFTVLLSLVSCTKGTDNSSAYLSDGDTTANSGNSIVVYNWGEYISNGDDDTMDVVKEFEKETGIKVTYLTFASCEEMYTKIKSGSVSYDVIIPSDYMIAKMIEEDMLLPINFDNIPNYQYINKDLLKKFDFDPENKFTVPYTWCRVGLLYNKKIVKEEPESWKILWDEKYSNKILMFDNARDAFGIAQKILGYSFNSDNPEEWHKAAELLKKEKPVVRSYVMDQIFPMMTSGEAALAPYYVGDAITIMGENPDVGFTVPKEGTNLFVDAMCIPKVSKNKEGAEAFINFMCSHDVALANAEYLCYGSPQTQITEEHKEYLREEYGDEAVDAIYPDSLDGCEIYKNLSYDTGKLETDLWLEVRANSHYTTSIIYVSAVMILLIFIIVFVKIKHYKRDKFIYND